MGLLKSPVSFLSRGASEDTPSVSVSLETGGELQKEAHTGRPLLLLSVESAPLRSITLLVGKSLFKLTAGGPEQRTLSLESPG